MKTSKQIACMFSFVGFCVVTHLYFVNWFDLIFEKYEILLSFWLAEKIFWILSHFRHLCSILLCVSGWKMWLERAHMMHVVQSWLKIMLISSVNGMSILPPWAEWQGVGWTEQHQIEIRWNVFAQLCTSWGPCVCTGKGEGTPNKDEVR